MPAVVLPVLVLALIELAIMAAQTSQVGNCGRRWLFLGWMRSVCKFVQNRSHRKIDFKPEKKTAKRSNNLFLYIV